MRRQQLLLLFLKNAHVLKRLSRSFESFYSVQPYLLRRGCTRSAIFFDIHCLLLHFNWALQFVYVVCRAFSFNQLLSFHFLGRTLHSPLLPGTFSSYTFFYRTFFLGVDGRLRVVSYLEIIQ